MQCPMARETFGDRRRPQIPEIRPLSGLHAADLDAKIEARISVPRGSTSLLC